VAMTVLLLDTADGEFCLRQELVAKLAQLGVTSVAFARDERTAAIVLEGWMFDPERSAEAAAEAVGAMPGARTLRPVMHVAVAHAAAEGG
jgi:hypothetical protein